MTRQNQYYNLMTMVKKDGMIDTNNGQKEYIGQYHEPIQIGTRLCELVKSGYLVSNQGKKYKYYTLTQKGTEWKDGEELIIKQYPKIKKTRAESEVKQEAQTYNYLKDTSPMYKKLIELNNLEHENKVKFLKEGYKQITGKDWDKKENNGPLIEKEAPPIDSELNDIKNIPLFQLFQELGPVKFWKYFDTPKKTTFTERFKSLFY